MICGHVEAFQNFFLNHIKPLKIFSFFLQPFPHHFEPLNRHAKYIITKEKQMAILNRSLLLVSTAVMLSACGGNKDKDNDNPSSTQDTVAEQTPPEVTEDTIETPVSTETRFRLSFENISPSYSLSSLGVQAVPEGSETAGPLLPGNSYSFTVEAGRGQRLSFASMLVQSNDWFVAPREQGISLYNEDGSAVSGDITSQLIIVDAGTEIDQAFGAGDAQPLRSGGANIGEADPNKQVREVTAADVPDLSSTISVQITALENQIFRITFTNNAASSTPFTPVLWTVHNHDAPLFSLGQEDRKEGLELLAEDGDPSVLVASLEPKVGVTSPFAPIAWALQGEQRLFQSGDYANDSGLETLAEDGGPGDLVEYAKSKGLTSGAVAVAQGASEPGPLFPGSTYVVEFTATPSQGLFLASMFVQSNDLFVSPRGLNLELFVDGKARTGDITSSFGVYDAGTEANQTLGIGNDQAPRQSAANTGEADTDRTIRGYQGLDLSKYLKVNLEVISN